MHLAKKLCVRIFFQEKNWALPAITNGNSALDSVWGYSKRDCDLFSWPLDLTNGFRYNTVR